MKISSKGRYALDFMIDIAEYGKKKCISIKETSQRLHCSQKYLEQIASILSKCGLIKSVRGASGGYVLTRQPCEYTVGDILRATEGSLSPMSCVGSDSVPCPRVTECGLLDFWKNFYNVIQDYVDSVTLEQLLQSKLQTACVENVNA